MYKWIVFAVCFCAGTFAGMSANLFPMIVQKVVETVCGDTDRLLIAEWSSYATASLLLGWTLGGIGLGLISDRAGRVYSLAFSILLYTISTLLLLYAWSLPVVCLFRLITGLGIGGTLVGVSVFISEAWPKGSRTIALGVIVASYQAGVFLSGALTHMVDQWQDACKVGCVPILLLLPVLWYFQEPAKASIQRQESGVKATNTYKLFIGSVIFGSLLVGYWASVAWIPAWINELSSNGNEKNIATMIHGICAILGCITAGFFAQRYSRRALIGISYLSALFFSWWMFLGFATFSPIIYLLNGLLGFSIGMAQATMYIYLPELFPLDVRATYVGVCLNIGRLMTIVAVMLVGFTMSYFSSYAEALSFFSTIYLVGATLSTLTPETKEV